MAATWALVALAALSLFGCAAGPGTYLQPGDRDKIRKVAVASVAGDVLHRRYLGLTALGNEEDFLDVRDWNLDEGYERALAEALTRRGLQVVEPRRDRAALYRVNQLVRDNPLADPAPNWPAVDGELRAMAAASGADAILLLLPQSAGDLFAGTQVRGRGLGIFTRGIGEHTWWGTAYLVAQLHLIDARTARPIVSRRVMRRINDVGERPKYRIEEPRLVRTALNALTATEKARLRTWFATFPVDGLRDSVNEVFEGVWWEKPDAVAPLPPAAPAPANR